MSVPARTRYHGKLEDGGIVSKVLRDQVKYCRDISVMLIRKVLPPSEKPEYRCFSQACKLGPARRWRSWSQQSLLSEEEHLANFRENQRVSRMKKETDI